MLDFLSFFLELLFSLLTFAFGWFLGNPSRKFSKKWIGKFAILSLLLILGKFVLLIKPAWEAQYFSYTIYLYFQSYWIYPPIFFFFGLVIPQFPLRWNRYFLLTIAFLFFLFSLEKESWRVCPPSFYDSARTADAKHHCHQSTLFTCAPSVCVALLSSYQIASTEGEMARLCGTTSSGSSILGIYRGLWFKLRGSPLRVRFKECSFSDLVRNSSPVVLAGMGHAVVVTVKPDQVLLNDPKMLTPIPMTLKQFEEGKYFEGLVIYLEKKEE
ncbi:MAG: cysteine peptidase family C39 domain-containing protein [Planctomycetota bacterium]